MKDQPSGSNGRYAPSPTGSLHLGNLRTALLAWLFARRAGAAFRLRVEDLDTARVRPGSEEEQLADLAALGLDWDGPVVRQSERLAHYAEALAALGLEGRVYPCFCTRAEIREAASAPHGAPGGRPRCASGRRGSPWRSRTRWRAGTCSRSTTRSCGATTAPSATSSRRSWT